MTVDLGSAAADRTIALGGGRVMTLREYGDPLGIPVIALHGTPASRLMYSAAKSAGRFGLRLIAPDRWGYGGTSAHPQPTLPAFVDDMDRVLEALGIERFALLGISGGGPYAAAMAALRPDRVTALALVAPVGPIAGVPGVRLNPFHRLAFTMLPHVPGVLRLAFNAFRRGLARSPSRAIDIAMYRAPAADRQVLANREVRQRFIAMFREGLRPGVDGALIDMRIFSRRWNVPLPRINAPAALWISDDDDSVPVDAALRLATAIPGCRLTELHGGGHLWVALDYDGVLGWIAGQQTGTAAARPESSGSQS